VANSTTVNSGGTMYVYSGGTALNVVWTPFVGDVRAAHGATVTYLSIYSGVYFGRGNTLLSSAVTMTGKYVGAGDSMYVMSGGTADSTTVNARGSMTVSSGGTATAIVENGGFVNVADGANVIFTPNTFSGLVLSSGSASVHSGTTAVHITLTGDDINFLWPCVTIFSGGTANDTTVNAAGLMYIESGGTANDTIVNWRGSLSVSSGGTANDTIVNWFGSLSVSSGGTTVNTTLSGGNLYVSGGGTANNNIVNSNGDLYVSSGGTANSTTMSGGRMYVYSGGTALNVVWTPCVGHVEAEDGATVTYISSYSGVYFGSDNTLLSSAMEMDGKVLSAHSMYVMSGGTANDTTVNSRGRMYVYSGGTARIVFNPWQGEITSRTGADITYLKRDANVYYGGSYGLISKCDFVSGLEITSGNSVLIYSGGTAGSTTVNSDGSLTVSGGGVANNATINSGGSLTVWNGIANSTTVNSSGRMYVSGGTADCTTVNSGGYLYASSGGTANSTTVNAGDMYVYSGGTANSTTVNSRSGLHVYSGGTASIVFNPWQGWVDSSRGAVVTYLERDANIYYGSNGVLISKYDSITEFAVTSGNSAIVFSGGTANNTTVNGGSLDVNSGGTANSTTMSGGRMWVSSGGTANNTTVNGGSLVVYSGGTANSTTMSGGRMYVYSNGVVARTTVNSGGSLVVYSGGTIRGLNIMYGGTVSAETGAKVDFDLTSRKPADGAVITNFTLLQGMPDYVITVNENQVNGIYKLAEGVGYFAAPVTITNTRGDNAGITIGNTVHLGEQDYTLSIESYALTLTVSGGSPAPVTGVTSDLNGDGRADVIMSITEPGHGAEGATGAWLIQSDQTAAWGDLSQRNPGWEIFGTGITLAGKATNDVYIKNADNVIGAWVTNDAGNVSGWETVGEFDGNTQILGLGDFNADGQSDLLLRNVNGAVGCFFTSGPTTGWNYFQSLGDEWKISAVGDFNGDGRDDVVLKHDAGFAGSWLTQSDGTMVWANLDTLPEGFAIIGAGDFDGDGVDDVLLKKDTYYGAWLVEAGSVKSWFGLGDLGDVTVEQIADFDGDGKDDLRIRTSAGDLGAQLVRAADTLEWRYYGSVGAEWSTSLAAI